MLPLLVTSASHIPPALQGQAAWHRTDGEFSTGCQWKQHTGLPLSVPTVSFSADPALSQAHILTVSTITHICKPHHFRSSSYFLVFYIHDVQKIFFKNIYLWVIYKKRSPRPTTKMHEVKSLLFMTLTSLPRATTLFSPSSCLVCQSLAGEAVLLWTPQGPEKKRT